MIKFSFLYSSATSSAVYSEIRLTALEPVQRPSVFSLEIVERARENKNRKRMGVWVGRGENCFFPRVSCSFSCASESAAESSKKKKTRLLTG